MSSESNELIIPDLPNFRDLGGMKTQSGKIVKKNAIFRSSFLGSIEEEDTMKLLDLSVDRIIDLRTTEEIDLTSRGNYPSSIEYIHVPMNAGNISSFLIPVFEQGAFDLIKPSLLPNIYTDLITKFNDELAAVYRYISTTENAIVFHCSHGKDRTGIISALLLDLLQVDRDDIYTDYLISNERLKSSNEFQMARIKQHFEHTFQREVSPQEFSPVESLFHCRHELLSIVFDYVDGEFGDVVNYFRSGLGLTENELASLRTNYLEDA